MLYGLKYKGSKQLVLRRTFPELKRSLILTSYTLYPKELGSYNESNHRWRFNNGSTIEFGYCDSDSDVSQYMSAEYDTIRFDELTTFTEYMYSYIISRLRGANKFPKQVKSSSNPGQVGHAWVKNRFINGHTPREMFVDEFGRSRVFIPATVRENTFLMESDPLYVKRLEQLPEKDRKALLDGDWDIFEGQYFDEFNKAIHVCEPFFIPSDWQRYVTMDYGLDMLAAYFIATDTHHNAYVYREVYQSGLIISEAAKTIREATLPGESIRLHYAPPDLWNKRQDTGKSASEIFSENRIHLYKASNERVQGWLNVKEWLKPVQLINEQNGDKFWTSRLKFFPECRNLIRCLSEIQHDEKKPNDVATEPHELTHAPDALRYFLAGRPARAFEQTLPQDFCYENDPDGGLRRGYVEGGWFD